MDTTWKTEPTCEAGVWPTAASVTYLTVNAHLQVKCEEECVSRIL